MPLCKTYYVNAETGRDSFDGLSEATWLAAVCLRGNTCT